MKKVAVIGHFGFGLTCLDGQTVKTKILTQALVDAFGETEVLKTDTHGGAKALLKAPFQIFSGLKNSKNVVILPAHNGLRVNAPLLAAFRRLFPDRKIHYAVIGGWLPQFLEGRKGLAKALKRFDGIYVETGAMLRAMEQQGFSNVHVMPNCKKLTPLTPEELVFATAEPYKLCTFSRVMKEKGIADAAAAVKTVNEKLGRTVYTLDIYGQVDAAQTEWFDELQKEFPEYVQYKGLVPFDQSVEVLKDYFALLFPTYYKGEGFAGTLLDAMASGTPVIASDWRYNAEIVKEGQTGVLYPAREQDALVERLLFAAENTEDWAKMQYHCVEEAKKYQPEEVIKVLLNQLKS